MNKKRLHLVVVVIILTITAFGLYPKLVRLSNEQIDPLVDNLLKFDNFPTGIFEKYSVVLNKQKDLIIANNQELKKAIYFSIKNISNVVVSPLVVVNGKNWSSNQAIVKQVFDNNKLLTDEDKAIKIMEYLSINNYHFSSPYYGFPDSDNPFKNPVIFFNFFGYGQCNNFSISFVTLSTIAGLQSRVVFLDGHVVAEVFYNNKWHMFDADGGCIYRTMKGEIASVDDIFNDPSVIPQNSRCEKHPFYLEKKVRYQENKDNNFLENSEHRLVMEYKLLPHEEIRFYYNWMGDYFGSDYDEEPSIYTNGLHISGINSKFMTIFEKEFRLPYPILGSYLYAYGLCSIADRIFISVGTSKESISGKDFCMNNVINFSKLFYKGKGQEVIHSYSIKINKLVIPVAFRFYTQFQVAPNSVPKLVKGNNTIQLIEDIDGTVEVGFAFE